MSDARESGPAGNPRDGDGRRDGDGWGTAAIWVLLGLMILGTVATAHSVWHTFLR